MSFYFNARYGLFTYSQSDGLDPWAVLECFRKLGGECIIGRELHEDGGTHLHVFVDFERRFRSRSAKVFDVDGFHPNVVASRGKPDQGYDYATKDGDVVAGGLARPDGITRRTGDSTIDTKWAEITSSTNREEFFRLVHELDPKSAVVHFPALCKYADWKFAPQPDVYRSPGNITFIGGDCDGRDMWYEQSGIGMEQSHVGKFNWYSGLGVRSCDLRGGEEPLRC